MGVNGPQSALLALLLGALRYMPRRNSTADTEVFAVACAAQ